MQVGLTPRLQDLVISPWGCNFELVLLFTFGQIRFLPLLALMPLVGYFYLLQTIK